MKEFVNIPCPPTCDSRVENRCCVPVRSIFECRECMIGCLYEALGDLRELTETLLEQEEFWQSDISFEGTLDTLRADIRALIKEIETNGNT